MEMFHKFHVFGLKLKIIYKYVSPRQFTTSNYLTLHKTALVLPDQAGGEGLPAPLLATPAPMTHVPKPHQHLPPHLHCVSLL